MVNYLKKSQKIQLFLGQNWTCQLFFDYFINYSAKKSSQLFSRLFFGSKLDMSIILSIILSIIQQKSLVNYFHDYFTLQLFFLIFFDYFINYSAKSLSIIFTIIFWSKLDISIIFRFDYLTKKPIIDQRLSPNDISPRSTLNPLTVLDILTLSGKEFHTFGHR